MISGASIRRTRIIQGWLESGDERPPANEPGQRRRLTPDMVAQDKIISHFVKPGIPGPDGRCRDRRLDREISEIWS